MLMRLYPSRWRAEYGEELAAILLRRPLGPRPILNVGAHAFWQQVRLQLPWLVAGVALMLWNLAVSTHDLVRRAPNPGDWRSLLPGMLLLLAVGFWSEFRHGRPGGRAAMKTILLGYLPLSLGGLLLLLHITHPARVAGNAFYLGFWGQAYFSDARIAWPLIVFPWLLLVPAGLIGWIGGLAGRWTFWIRRNRATR